MSDSYYDKANEDASNNDSRGSQVPRPEGYFGPNGLPHAEAAAHAQASQTISRVALRTDDLVVEPVENFINVWMHYITNLRAEMGTPIDPEGAEAQAMVQYLGNLQCQLRNLSLVSRALAYAEVVNGQVVFKYTEYGSQAMNDANRLGFGSSDEFPGQAEGWRNQPH